MARNGSGVYSLPAGSTITNGDTSDATDLNTPLADLESDANVARPVVAGGTGATSASAARTNLGLAIGTDVQAYDANLPTWPATVDATEVGYLNGVTSAIQTQIDGKAASSHTHTHADVTDYDTELAGKTNTTSFTPTADYHPATKKYVDDNSGGGWTRLTAQATTSGTAFDFTIPSGASVIKVCFDEVNLTVSDHILVQLGDSGGIETTGYDSTSSDKDTNVSDTTGFIMRALGADVSGIMELVLMDSSSNTWVSGHTGTRDGGQSLMGGGVKDLSAELTTVRITRDGSATFSSGSVNVLYM